MTKRTSPLIKTDRYHNIETNQLIKKLIQNKINVIKHNQNNFQKARNSTPIVSEYSNMKKPKTNRL